LKATVASTKARKVSADDIELLTTRSRQFEEAAVEVPILSVYETRETKVKTGFATSKRTLVSSTYPFLIILKTNRFSFLLLLSLWMKPSSEQEAVTKNSWKLTLTIMAYAPLIRRQVIFLAFASLLKRLWKKLACAS
jgi:hypothetical protein